MVVSRCYSLVSFRVILVGMFMSSILLFGVAIFNVWLMDFALLM